MARPPKCKTVRPSLEHLEARILLSSASVIVGFDGGPSPADTAMLGSMGARISKTWFDGRIDLVTLAQGANVSAALVSIRALPQVRYAETDNLFQSAAVVPNDPLFSSQWALKNSNNVDIGATLAWGTTTGSSSTLVAVLDTGVDYTHPDLYLNIAINQSEIPVSLRSQVVDTDGDGNGLIDFYDLNSLDASGHVVYDALGKKYNSSLVTDLNGNGYIDAGDLLADPRWSSGVDGDGNGLVDDLTGWDFLTNTNNPIDPNGHGTHVTGIIAAQGDNGVGVAGVNWNARILPLRVNNGSGVSTSNAIAGIQYAVTQGAKVINASFGDYGDDPALMNAIQIAGDYGTVVVAAAGNQSNNNDNVQHAYYPASYDLPNLISVASVDSNGYLSGFSNFGQNSVDLAAPGEGILSTWPAGGYAIMSGTSMAAPYVTGVVSLLAGLYPTESAAWLVDRVLSTVTPLGSLAGTTTTGGMVNAYSALTAPIVAGPRIIASNPSGAASAPVNSVVLTFDRPIQADTFTTDDVSMIGPNGSIAPTAVNMLNPLTFAVVFPSQVTPGTYTLSVGPNIQDQVGRVMDQNQNGVPGEVPGDRYTTGFTIDPLHSVQYLDDGGAGFSATAGWQVYNGAGWQGDMRYKPAGSGAEAATWTFTGLAPGQYRVSATWVPYANRADNAPYTVLDGATPLATVLVNQQQAPAGLSDAGTSWQDLGGPYTVISGSLTVRLGDLADGYLIADAVRIERIGGPASPAGPQAQVLDGTTAVPDATGQVDFGRTDPGTPLTRTFTVSNTGTSDLTLGAIALPAGFSLAAGFGATTLAPGAATTFTIRLDAAATGTYSGAVGFATNDPNQNPFTFTVSGTVSAVQYLDDGGAGFSATAGWQVYNGAGWQGDMRYKPAGSGAEAATWTFTGLAPGQYRVSATWVPYANRADNAPYTVLDGATPLATVLVNQQQAPAGLSDAGTSWQDLGGPYTVISGSLTVRLGDLADGYLIADAVRIERIGGPASPAGPQAQVLDGTTAVPDATGQVDFGRTDPGTPLTRTFTVSNTGTSDLTLGAIALPAGFSLAAGFGATTLAPGAATTFTIRLDAAATGTYSGAVGFATNDPNQNPFTFTVSGTVSAVQYLDDGGAGFSATAGWQVYNGAGWQGDMRYKPAGSGAEAATWTFTGLAPGQYRVSATWVPYANRADNAPYTVLDGATPLATVLVNQQQAPAGLSDAGTSWQDLGGPYTVISGSLTVRLGDLADGYLIADAVRIERIGGPASPAGPQAQVLDGTTAVPDATGQVDFGRTDPGTPLTRTFTVSNTGTSDLTLGAIALPAGFSLAAGFGATTLAPGAATTFTIRLDAAATGTYSGAVGFATNDPNQNPFTFTVSGTVSAVQYLDDGGAGFSATAGWQVYNGAGWQGDMRYKPAGSGAEAATWTFTGLAPGQYRVSATWVPYANRADNAPYTVLDGATPLATVLVNQQQAPAGLSDAGTSWQDLGGPYTVISGSLTVRLGDLADGYLIADAVRIERL